MKFSIDRLRKRARPNTENTHVKTHLHVVLHDIFDGAHLIDDVGAHQLHGGLALERGDRVVKLQIERVDLPIRRLLDVSGSVGGGGRVAARSVVAHLCNQPQRCCPRHHRRRRRGRHVLQEADHGQRQGRRAALAQLLAGATSSRYAPQKRHRFGESEEGEEKE